MKFLASIATAALIFSGAALATPPQTNPKTVSLWGDSLTAPFWDHFRVADTGMSVAAGGAGAFTVVNRASAGESAHMARWRYGSWAPGAGHNFGGDFAQVAPLDAAQYQAFRWGGIEALFQDNVLSDFLADLYWAVDSSIAAGRKPILITPITMPFSNVLTTTFEARLTVIDQHVRTVAAHRNVPLVDVRNCGRNCSFTFEEFANCPVSPGGPRPFPTLAEDCLHPNAAAYHRIGMEIGRRIKAILDSGY